MSDGMILPSVLSHPLHLLLCISFWQSKIGLSSFLMIGSCHARPTGGKGAAKIDTDHVRMRATDQR